MSGRLVLHVGAMKSGTSYLQELLFANQASLAAQGVLVPGAVWADQARAVRQALATRPARPRWEELVAQVRAHPGTAVISMEYLGPVGARTARGVLADLGVDDVTVVITARDLNRVLVSMWQETIQNGRSWTWSDYVADVAANRPGRGKGVEDRTTPGGTFWRQQHLARMTGAWASLVGAEQVVVVTVPPPGAEPSLLAERFVTASGVPLDVDLPVSTANETLGLASVLALRELNERLDSLGLSFPAGAQVRKRLLAKTVMAARRSQEPRLGLRVADWVRHQAADTVAVLSESGTRLVGEWDDLTPVDVPGVDPDDVTDADRAAAAVAALAGLVADRIDHRS